jgi:hypothetical protein
VIEYELRVDIAGASLTSAEIERRYHVPQAGRFENVPQHLIDIVQQYERTHGRHDHASVDSRRTTRLESAGGRCRQMSC